MPGATVRDTLLWSMGRPNVTGPFAYYAAYLLPLTVWIGYCFRDYVPGGSLFTVVFAYCLVPVVEASVSLVWPATGGPGGEELRREQLKELDSDAAYRFAVLLWPFVQFSLLFWCLTRPLEGLDTTTFLGMSISMGFVAAGGINVAHELFHKPVFTEKLLGRALLLSVGYGHFALEHSKGHHRNVATPLDPATARLGEGFYAFLPRTLLGSFVSAWQLGGGFTIFNEVVHSLILQGLLASVIYCLWGQLALCVWAVHAVVGVVLLEKINFIEHYGLCRKRLPDGNYERVGPQHSWDAPQQVTNVLLFKLQRHADHHQNCRKKYQSLCGLEGSPELPFGYATLAVIALFPPLWRLMMAPRVNAAKLR